MTNDEAMEKVKPYIFQRARKEKQNNPQIGKKAQKRKIPATKENDKINVTFLCPQTREVLQYFHRNFALSNHIIPLYMLSFF